MQQMDALNYIEVLDERITALEKRSFSDKMREAIITDLSTLFTIVNRIEDRMKQPVPYQPADTELIAKLDTSNKKCDMLGQHIEADTKTIALQVAIIEKQKMEIQALKNDIASLKGQVGFWMDKFKTVVEEGVTMYKRYLVLRKERYPNTNNEEVMRSNYPQLERAVRNEK